MRDAAGEGCRFEHSRPGASGEYVQHAFTALIGADGKLVLQAVVNVIAVCVTVCHMRSGEQDGTALLSREGSD